LDYVKELAEQMLTLHERMDAIANENAKLHIEVAQQQKQINYLMSRHSLARGLLPDLASLSMIECQIFRRETLTVKQRQARFGHWSVKIEVSIE
jgi:hypothetical protein